MTLTKYMPLLPVIIPIIAALMLAFKCFEHDKTRHVFVFAAVMLNSLCIGSLILFPPDAPCTLLAFTQKLSLTFHVDGMSKIFGAIIAILWPITSIYAFDYMKHEGHKRKFFAFFMLSYATAAGTSFAANLETMYMFFELLTLATLPLVMHKMDDMARAAGKKYLLYSMAGAAAGFIALVFISVYGASTDFIQGGTLGRITEIGNVDMLRIAFTLAFFGFGVKAALFPMFAWLPAASVAPTPVTALLHAVAVVKAGAFACIRITYYSFGTELLVGTFAQYLPMTAAVITIISGSLMALRSNHLKRRMAWSTVSNLSYILFAVTIMSFSGLLAAAQHMIFHAFIKITLFFCVGAVMEKSGREYLDEIGGIGKKMPLTFACFTIAGIALMGVPPLPAFFSKWSIGTAAALAPSPFAYAGIAALIISALLTGLYIIGISVKAYSAPSSAGKISCSESVYKESAMMNAPILILTVCIILLGCFSGDILELITAWLS